jgi:hypothetical protein
MRKGRRQAGLFVLPASADADDDRFSRVEK